MIVISGARVLFSGTVIECKTKTIEWFDTVRRLKGNEKPTGGAVWRAVLRLRAGHYGILAERKQLEVRCGKGHYDKMSCRAKAYQHRLKEAMK